MPHASEITDEQVCDAVVAALGPLTESDLMGIANDLYNEIVFKQMNEDTSQALRNFGEHLFQLLETYDDAVAEEIDEILNR